MVILYHYKSSNSLHQGKIQISYFLNLNSYGTSWQWTVKILWNADNGENKQDN